MKKGFTLVEMLVVIGIIAILTAALVGSYAGATKKAQIAKGRELVSNVATALAAIFQQDGRWPSTLVDASSGDFKLGPRPAAVLARKGVLSLSYDRDNNKLTGIDEYGVLDPWGQQVLQGNAKANESSAVPSGGKVSDHILYFAIDDDGDGFTEATICGKAIKVRSPAIVWSTGPDGVFGKFEDMGRGDDIFSFRKAQIVE